MTIHLTPSQQSELEPLHRQASQDGGSLLMGIDRVSFDQPDARSLVLRVRAITGEEKMAMAGALEKLKAKRESKI